MTTAEWTKWCNARGSGPPPGPQPPAKLLAAMRKKPGNFHAEGTLLRISSAAQEAAGKGELSPEGYQLWLQAVILAHAMFVSDKSSGAYGWTDSHGSDAMTALLPGAFGTP